MAKKTPEAGAATPPEAGVVVALLVDHPLDGTAYKAGTPLQVDADTADALVNAGIADGNEAAVAYRVGELGLPVVVHVKPAPEAEVDEPAA